jgi:PPOX class probable F420-dependent enzyme
VDVSEFDRHHYMNLATFRKSGAEVKTPVWFAALDGKLYFYSAGDAGKVKRLRNSDKARIAPCDIRGNVEGEWRDTAARLVSDPAVVERAYGALRAKYGWQVSLGSFLSRLAGKIRKRIYIEVDF